MVTRNARLKDFISDGYPGSGLPVQALAEDHAPRVEKVVVSNEVREAVAPA
jgi:hypothetical protein